MSEKMLHGVLNAPVEAGDVIGVLQLKDRAKEASELIIKQDAEIAALKAERDKYVKVLDKVNHILSQYPLAYGVKSRMNVPGIVKMMLAEIERKDVELRRVLVLLKSGHKGLAIQAIEQSLQTKEG